MVKFPSDGKWKMKTREKEEAEQAPRHVPSKAAADGGL